MTDMSNLKPQPAPSGPNALAGATLSAFHVWWSLPTRQDSNPTGLPDHIVLLMILSALQWRKLNGPITLYGDSPAITFLDKLGVLGAWENHDATVCDSINPLEINPLTYWSAGKFFVLQRQSAPIVALDTDLIVWRDLRPEITGFDIRFTHWESATPSPWYPRRKALRRPVGYRFSPAWRWKDLRAANTAIMYFGHHARQDLYAVNAINYLTRNCGNLKMNGLVAPELLFAEQRLLAMHIAALGLRARAFLDAVWEPSCFRFSHQDSEHGPWCFSQLDNQPLFTHCWFHKERLLSDEYTRRLYCSALLERIAASSPAISLALDRAGFFRRYSNRLD